MSLSTNSSTASPYAAASTGGGVLRAIENAPAAIAAGVADVGEAVGDAASATVSFSARALQALADGGMAVVHGVEDVIAFPFEMAADAVVGVEHAIEGGAHMIVNGVQSAVNGIQSAIDGASSAVHAVTVELPQAIASDVANVAESAMDGATSVAGTAATVAALTGGAGVKMIGALL